MSMAAVPSPVWQWMRRPVSPMAQRGRADQLSIDLRERARVDSGLDEPGPHARPLDAVSGLRRPALGQPLRALLVRVRGHVFVLGRAVVAGVRDDVEPARLREADEQRRIAPQPGRRALDERPRAALLEGKEMRQHGAEGLAGVVAARAHLVRAHEVDEHVLVDERGAEVGRVHRPAHGHGTPSLRPEGRDHHQGGQGGQEPSAANHERSGLAFMASGSQAYGRFSK